MTKAYQVTMGDRGRVVVPLEARRALGLDAGTPLVLMTSDDGIALVPRDRLKERVRQDLTGLDLVHELLDDRRRQAAEQGPDDTSGTAAGR